MSTITASNSHTLYPEQIPTQPRNIAAFPIFAGIAAGTGGAIIIESVLATGILVLGTYVAYTVTKAISQAIIDATASFGKKHVYSKLTQLRDAVKQAYADGSRRFGPGSENAYKHMQKLVTDWINKPVGAPVVPTPQQPTTKPEASPTTPPPAATLDKGLRHDAEYFMGVPASELKVKLSDGVISRFSTQLPKHHGAVTPMWIQESTGKFSLSPKTEAAGWAPYLATVDNGKGGVNSSEPGGALVLVRKHNKFINFLKSKWPPKPPKLPQDPNTWTLILVAIGTVGGLWQVNKHHEENKVDSKKTRDAIQQAETNRIRAQQDQVNRTADVDTAMTGWSRPAVFKDNLAKATALFEMTKHYIAQGEKLIAMNGIADGVVKGDNVFLARYQTYSKDFLGELAKIVVDVKAAKDPDEASAAMKSLAATAVAFRPPQLPVQKDNPMYAENRDRPNETLNLITARLVTEVTTKTYGISTGKQLSGNTPSAYDAIKAFGDATRTGEAPKPSVIAPSPSSPSNLSAKRAEIHKEIRVILKALGLDHLKIIYSNTSLSSMKFTRAMFIADKDVKTLPSLEAALSRVNQLIEQLLPIAEKQTGDLRKEMIAGPNGTLSTISKDLAQKIRIAREQQ
jgi:hypothetical protein